MTQRNDTFNISILILLIILLLCVILDLSFLKKNNIESNSLNKSRINITNAQNTIPNKTLQIIHYNNTLINKKYELNHENLKALIDALAWAYHNKTSPRYPAIISTCEAIIKLGKESIVEDASYSEENFNTYGIYLPILMAYYNLLDENGLSCVDESINFIFYLIENPYKLKMYPNVMISDYEAVLLAGPFILAHYKFALKNNVLDRFENEILKDSSYLRVLSFIKGQYNQVETGKPGLHRDESFINKYGMLDFSKLERLNSLECNYFYALDTLITENKLQNAWQNVSNIIFHPSIPIYTPGFYGKPTSLSIPNKPTTPRYGIEILPFGRFIRYYTDKFQFNATCLLPNTTFNKNTSKNDIYYQSFYRNVHTSNFDVNLKYPDVNFITTEINSDSFSIKTVESAIFKYKQFGFLYSNIVFNDWAIPKLQEIIMIDSIKNTITLYRNNNEKQSAFISTKGPINRNYIENTAPSYTTTFDLSKNFTESTIYKDEQNFFPNNVFPLNHNITITKYDECMILRDSLQIKILCPLYKKTELENDCIVYNGNSFVYDSVEKQYMYQSTL